MDGDRGKYGLLVLLIIVMTIVPIVGGIGLEGQLNEDILTKLILLFVMMCIWLLSYLIKRTKRLYWLNQFTKKDYDQMDDKLIDKLSRVEHDIFTRYCIIYLIVAIISLVFNLSWLVDLVAMTMCSLLMAINSYIVMYRINRENENSIRNEEKFID